MTTDRAPQWPYEYIESTRDCLGGALRFKGHRVFVDQLLLDTAEGMSLKEFADEYGVDLEKVHIGLREAADLMHTVRNWPDVLRQNQEDGDGS